MARKSSRLAAQCNTLTATTTKEAVPAHTRKKQKVTAGSETVATTSQIVRETSSRKVRGKRGMLKNIIGMPLDILMEILGQLQPIDLLHISRSSKELRAIVTDSSAHFLWKKVYANAPEPAPLFLPGMNVLHYTNLVYGRNCFFCPSTRGSVVHYGARVRMCNECTSAHLIPFTEKQKSEPAAELCAFGYLEKHRGFESGPYILREEFERHKLALKLCQNVDDELIYRKTWGDRRKASHSLSGQLMAWDHRRKFDALQKSRQIRERRRAAVVSKLQALGYGKEVGASRYRLERLPGVWLSKELTDQSWENMKHTLIAVYELQRQEVIERDMIRRFRNRIDHYIVPLVDFFSRELPNPPITAPWSDIARSEHFCSLMKTYGPGVDEEAIGRQIQDLKPFISDASREWRVKADKVLLGLINREAKNSSTTIDDAELDSKPLELATTFFRCHWCAEALSYPRVLMHSCVRNRIFRGEDDDEQSEVKETADDKDEDKESNLGDEEEDELEDDEKNDSDEEQSHGIPKTTPEGVWAKMSSWYGSTWNEGDNQITVDEEATNSAKAIVAACGEDPTTFTATAMEELNIRIECTRCSITASKKARKRLVMTWRSAILHDMECHYETTPAAEDWQLVRDEADLNGVKEAEEKASKRCKELNGRCHHCNIYLSTSAVKSHLLEKHDICEDDEKALKKHFYMALDMPMKIPPYPVKI